MEGTSSTNYKILNCEITELNEEKIIKLIEQDDLNEKNNYFLSISKNEYQSGLIKKSIQEFDKNYEITNLTKNLNFMKSKNVNVKINDNSKTISVDFKGQNGRLIFFKSNLDSWKIYMNNKVTANQESSLLTKKK